MVTLSSHSVTDELPHYSEKCGAARKRLGFHKCLKWETNLCIALKSLVEQAVTRSNILLEK